MDLDILAVMGPRENYDKYSRFVQTSALSSEAWQIFQAIGEWFSSNKQTESIDWSSFAAWLTLARFAKMDKTKLQAIKAIVSMLQGRVTDESGVEMLLRSLAKRDYASQIAEHALRIADGDYEKEFDEIDTLLHQYHSLTGRMDSIESKVGAFSLDDLVSVSEPGLSWRLSALRESCGDVRKADLVVFGKS